MDLCPLLCCFDVQFVTFTCSFWTSACFPQLQRPIHHGFLLLLDFCLLPRSFDVQFTTVSCSFWTSACFPAASTSNPSRFLAPFGLLPCFPAALTSNPPRFLAHFGLLPCLPQLQRPIHHGFLLLLDFCHASRSFNVQSTTLSCSFWTSAMPPAASTSNPPRFLAPFGLPPCLPQLQRPIPHGFLLLLDFYHASRRFNVQSTTVSCSFWTSAMPPAALTSNPHHFLCCFGLQPASPPPKSPIHHASNPPRIQATLASPQPQAPHNAKKQHQHISASIALYLLILLIRLFNLITIPLFFSFP